MSKKVLELLKQKFPEAVLETHSFRGDDTATVKAENIKQICEFLKHDPKTQFDMPIDLTCVDYPMAKNRFVVVYHLRSTKYGHRIRLKVPLPANNPAIRSVVDVWKGFTWFEREVYDMFGIQFLGHPCLRRILLYPEFKGHPLRKDYPVNLQQPLVSMPRLDSNMVRQLHMHESEKDGK